MPNTLRIVTAASFLAATLASAPAAPDDLIRGWDADGDGTIGEDEFRTGFDEYGVFENMDTDRDDVVSEGEFYNSRFNAYDVDGSGAPEEPELGELDTGSGAAADR